MLRSKVYQEYARWWEFWLSKLPQDDASSPSRVKAALLNSHSSSILEDRLRLLRNPARTLSPMRCPTEAKGLYIDEES